VVQAGDTLQSIAQAEYGDASLWYVIAQANALGSDSDLAIGQRLTIPQVTTNSNTATTFKPYDPSSIVGSTTPNLPTIAPPPPPSSQHCKALSEIIAIAVTVIVTYYSGNPGAGAAAGNLAGQYSAMMFNGQYDWHRAARFALNPFSGNASDFARTIYDPPASGAPGKADYKSAAIAAAAAEAGSYAGAYVGAATGSTAAGAVAAAGAQYTANVELSKAAGYDTSFSLRELGATMGTAYAGAEISSALSVAPATYRDPTTGATVRAAQSFSWTQLVEQATTDVLTEGANYVIRKAVGLDVHWNWQDVAGQVAGNAIGNGTVAGIAAYRTQQAMARINTAENTLLTTTQASLDKTIWGNTSVDLETNLANDGQAALDSTWTQMPDNSGNELDAEVAAGLGSGAWADAGANDRASLSLADGLPGSTDTSSGLTYSGMPLNGRSGPYVDFFVAPDDAAMGGGSAGMSTSTSLLSNGYLGLSGDWPTVYGLDGSVDTTPMLGDKPLGDDIAYLNTLTGNDVPWQGTPYAMLSVTSLATVSVSASGPSAADLLADPRGGDGGMTLSVNPMAMPVGSETSAPMNLLPTARLPVEGRNDVNVGQNINATAVRVLGSLYGIGHAVVNTAVGAATLAGAWVGTGIDDVVGQQGLGLTDYFQADTDMFQGMEAGAVNFLSNHPLDATVNAFGTALNQAAELSQSNNLYDQFKSGDIIGQLSFQTVTAADGAAGLGKLGLAGARLAIDGTGQVVDALGNLRFAPSGDGYGGLVANGQLGAVGSDLTGIRPNVGAGLDASGDMQVIEEDGSVEVATNRIDVPNSAPRLTFQPSSGVVLEAIPGKTTTILGNYSQDMKAIVNELGNVKSTDFGPRTGGFNVLNVPDDLYITPKQFWTEYNQPWLSNTVTRGDPILMATQPQFGPASGLFRLNDATGKLELSGFGKEYLYLRQSGLRYDPITKQMVRSP
ncbi:MAG: LysM peptidoglycan-binding domain-containing protein, partial [Rhodanobacter sp.]